MANFNHTALRGFLANVSTRPPLVLPFMWNPSDIKEQKSAKYTSLQVGGYHAPVQLFTSGGAHTYKFSLMFDGTADNKSVNIFRIPVPPITGVEPAIQTLMSFLYPASTRGLLNTSGGGFGAPPKCYFGMGPRVVSGYITNIDVSYSLYDAALIPRRATCAVSFTETEDGLDGQINAIFRRANVALQLGQNI